MSQDDNGRREFRFKPRANKLELCQQTLDMLYANAAHQHTKRETASLMGVCYETLRKFMIAHPEAKEAWEDGRQAGRALIRRQVIAHARTDPSTARFLADRILGMSRKMDEHKARLAGKSMGAALGEAADRRMMSEEEAERRILELSQKLQVEQPSGSLALVRAR